MQLSREVDQFAWLLILQALVQIHPSATPAQVAEKTDAFMEEFQKRTVGVL